MLFDEWKLWNNKSILLEISAFGDFSTDEHLRAGRKPGDWCWNRQGT